VRKKTPFIFLAFSLLCSSVALAQEENASKFWKSRSQTLNHRHVITPRLGTFYNRIDGDQASTQSEGYFLSSLSWILGADWEFQQSSGWSTLLSAGLKIYRYKQDIEPTLFSKDHTFVQPEIWLGMGKRLAIPKPLMVRVWVGTYKDLYYFAPTFNSLKFENDQLIALKTEADWTAKSWKNKDIGVGLYVQTMRRGQFLRGGSEIGARVLFSAYPVRVKYEFSASFLKTTSLSYRMLEGAVILEYLFGL